MCAKKYPIGNDANLHAGHRKRAMNHFKDKGLDYFNDHEKLEILLFYAIPRKNTNELAHILINRFGSLDGVFNAAPEELMTVSGIGPKAVEVLKLPQQMLASALEAKKHYIPRYIKSAQDVKQVLDERTSKYPLPAVFLLCLDVNDVLLSIDSFPCGLPYFAIKLNSVACISKASRLILAERYDEPAHPITQEKLSSIQTLAKQLWVLDYHLVEYYFIYSDGKIKGLRRRGQLI